MNFQNEGTFASNVGVIKVFSLLLFNSVDLTKPNEFSKIPTLFFGFKRGLDCLNGFFPKTAVQI